MMCPKFSDIVQVAVVVTDIESAGPRRHLMNAKFL